MRHFLKLTKHKISGGRILMPDTEVSSITFARKSEGFANLFRRYVAIQSDPSNPVVVLPGRSKEPETLVSVLSQQALLPPRAPEQHHRHQQEQHDGGDLVQKLTS